MWIEPIGPRRRVQGRIALTLATGGFVIVLAACSFVLDTANDQCAADADCGKFGASATCGIDRVCKISVARSEGGTSEGGSARCTTNAECQEAQLCDVRSGTCGAVTNADCTAVIGTTRAQTPALILGAVIPPFEGANKTAQGAAIKSALQLAVDELNDNTSDPGMPGKGKFAVLLCSDGAQKATAGKATDYLIGALKTPIVIGGSSGAITQEISNRTQAAKALLLVPTGTSIRKSDETTGANVRVIPDDLAGPSEGATKPAEGVALARLVEDREAAVRAAVGADAGAADLKLYLLSRDDAHSQSVASAFKDSVRWNGASRSFDTNKTAGNAFDFSYSDPTAAAEDAVRQVLVQRLNAIGATRPHMIVIVGGSETLSGIIQAYDQTAVFKPFYFLSSGLLQPELWRAYGGNALLRQRSMGVAPAPGDVAAGSLFDQFQTRFTAKDTTGAGTAAITAIGGYYDAVYAAAFAFATVGPSAADGPALVAKLDLLSAGGATSNGEVGPDTSTDKYARLNGIFADLKSGRARAFRGVAGADGIDALARGAKGTLQTWCMPRIGSTAAPAIFTGRHLADPPGATLTGAPLGNVTQACTF